MRLRAASRPRPMSCGSLMVIPVTAMRSARRKVFVLMRAAAVLIEDKIWPRPLGREGAKLVVDREHAILRCRAAVEACRDEGLLLLARTDPPRARGLGEARGGIRGIV